jgi:hypothetical protein
MSLVPCWSHSLLPRLLPLREWLGQGISEGSPRTHSAYDYNEVFLND